MSITTTEPVKKPIWTRCKGPEGKGNGCGQRVFNAPVDIERHRQHCPADLERVVDKLEKRIEKLERTEIPEQLDLDDVADDWPTDDEQLSQYAGADDAGTVELSTDTNPDDEDDVDDGPVSAFTFGARPLA